MTVTGNLNLDALMPMHMCLTSEAGLISLGPTLRRICGNVTDLDAGFLLGRSEHDRPDLAEFMSGIRNGRRVFLRLRAHPDITLRGGGTTWGDGVLLNLGFGNSLVSVVTRFALTDSDFAPADLALELLFLHEANRAVVGELHRFHRRLAAAHDAAAEQAMTDPMTGLLNRRGFEAALKTVQNSGVPFALIQLDLDRFKDINDTYGHAAGDAVLMHVASVLQAETRSRDKVARLGGDEFVVLLAGVASQRNLVRFKQRIRREIEIHLPFQGVLLPVETSLGASSSIFYRNISISHMLSDADAALYRMKLRKSRARRHLTKASSPY